MVFYCNIYFTLKIEYGDLTPFEKMELQLHETDINEWKNLNCTLEYHQDCILKTISA